MNLVNECLRLIGEQDLTYGELAYKSGIHLSTVKNFIKGKGCNFATVESIFDELGYEIVIKEKSNEI